jgi:hypothetical protein
MISDGSRVPLFAAGKHISSAATSSAGQQRLPIGHRARVSGDCNVIVHVLSLLFPEPPAPPLRRPPSLRPALSWFSRGLFTNRTKSMMCLDDFQWGGVHFGLKLR